MGAPFGSKNTLGKHWKVKDTSKMHHIAWNKGIPMSEEAKAKMSAKKIGKPSGRKGEKLSVVLRMKLREAHLGQQAWNKGKKCPQYSGDNHWNWQGGITSETKKRTNTLEWDIIRKRAYERDNWNCQLCGKHCSDDIQCHHIIPWKISKNDDMSNLVTLCKACHLRVERGLLAVA